VFVAVEAQKQLNDYKYKLKKAEQDITTLEGNVSASFISPFPPSLFPVHSSRITVVSVKI